MPERMRSFGELVMRHRGQRICVMGGGPTLATDLESVEADVWISVNEHEDQRADERPHPPAHGRADHRAVALE